MKYKQYITICRLIYLVFVHILTAVVNTGASELLFDCIIDTGILGSCSFLEKKSNVTFWVCPSHGQTDLPPPKSLQKTGAIVVRA